MLSFALFNGVRYAAGLIGTYTSTDGKTWTAISDTDANFRTIFVANGILFGTKKLSNGVYYSTDGTTWTATNITTGTLNNIIYFSNTSTENSQGLPPPPVYVANCSGVLYYSTDGITWTTLLNYKSKYMYSANGVLIITSSNSTANYIYSADGICWSYGNVPLTDVVFANGYWSGGGEGLYYC
jgi:hypothetical protein